MGATYDFQGFDIPSFTAGFKSFLDFATDEVAGEMAVLGAKLVDRMRDTLLKAVTRTGLARAARGGGVPGRRRSGQMMDLIDYDVSVERGDALASGNTVVLTWGWLMDLSSVSSSSDEGVTMDGTYFLLQDYGTDKIPAAGSLADSFTLSVAETARILQEMSPR